MTLRLRTFFFKMTLDLTDRHATGIQGKNLVIKVGPAGLVLGDDLWLEAAEAVAENFDSQFAKVALEGLLAFAIVGVASRVGNRFILGVAQVVGHLGLKGMQFPANGPFTQTFLHPRQPRNTAWSGPPI